MNEGEDVGNYEMKQEERGNVVIHCYHGKNEMDGFLESLGLEMYRKSIKETKVPYQGKIYNMSYIDYIYIKK